MRFSDCRTIAAINDELQRRLRRHTFTKFKITSLERARQAILALAGDETRPRYLDDDGHPINDDDALSHAAHNGTDDDDVTWLDRKLGGKRRVAMGVECGKPQVAPPDGKLLDDGRYGDEADYQISQSADGSYASCDRLAVPRLPERRVTRFQLLQSKPVLYGERVVDVIDWQASYHIPCRFTADSAPAKLVALPPVGEIRQPMTSYFAEKRIGLSHRDFMADTLAPAAAPCIVDDVALRLESVMSWTQPARANAAMLALVNP